METDESNIIQWYQTMMKVFKDLSNPFEKNFNNISTKPSLPTIKETIIDRPKKDKDGNYDQLALQEYLVEYKVQKEEKALVEKEAKKAFHILRQMQDRTSRAVCERDKNYKKIEEEEDFVAYLELIRSTHMGEASKDPALTKHNEIQRFYLVRLQKAEEIPDFNIRFNDLLDSMKASGTKMTEEDTVERYLSAISLEPKGDQYVSLIRQRLRTKPTTIIEAMEEACKYTPIAEYADYRKTKNTSSFGTTVEEYEDATVATKPAKGPGTCKHCKKYYNKDVKHYLDKCENYKKDMELMEHAIRMRDGTSKEDMEFQPPTKSGTYMQVLDNTSSKPKPSPVGTIALGLNQKQLDALRLSG